MFDICKLKATLVTQGKFVQCAKLQLAVDNAKTQRGIEAAVYKACKSARLAPHQFDHQLRLR
jgi:hypothetical protein